MRVRAWLRQREKKKDERLGLHLKVFHDATDPIVIVDLEGRAETMVETPHQCSGLGWLPDGRLLVVSMPIARPEQQPWTRFANSNSRT